MDSPFDRNDLLRALGPLPLDAGEAAALAEAILSPQPPAIRLNTLGRAVAADAVPFAAAAVPWFDGPAWFCAPDTRPAGHALFAAGAYYVQDAASLLPVTLLDPKPGDLVCDLCAAPGGKTTAILERLCGTGWLLANEVVQSRVPPLLLNLARHGSTRWVQTCLDPAELALAAGPVFDAVLVDAPCTAQSLVARGRQTGRAFDPGLIAHSAARQSRILDAAVRLLRPGGRLVYSTCTFAWDENEGQIAALLSRFPRLRPDPVSSLSEYKSPAATAPACYRLWPHRHRCAGGFAARVVAEQTDRAGPSDTPTADKGRRDIGGRPECVRVGHPNRAVCTDAHRRKSPRARQRGSHAPPAALPADWGRWLEPVSIDTRRDRVFAWPAGLPLEFADLADAGPEVAFLKGQTWFPAYALAMRRDGAFEPRISVRIEEHDLRRFLAGENVPGTAEGWAVATYRDLPLAWVKGHGRTLKNHLPRSARILLT